MRHSSQGPSGGDDGGALLGGGVVALAQHAGVEDDVRHLGADEGGQFGDAPLLLVAVPLAVEPHQVGPVAAGEFADLAVAVGEEPLPGFQVLELGGDLGVAVVLQLRRAAGLAGGGVVGVVPVGVRVVEADLETLLAQGLGVAGDQVAAHVQLAVRGVPQGDPVVVAAGEDGVPGPGPREEPRPVARVVAGGREPVELGHVPVVRDDVVVERPGLLDAVDGVDAPVHEDAELGVLEPRLHGHEVSPFAGAG
ncbi:hypothetical protein HNR72_006181 [Streptomyces collinus]|uniref:Uncharacterized protein n=1 Tax=Streptomyces collinus TaxID=42684 RepID=A0AA89QAI9_STRCU|nr:hypothetical protein [Streptomyces collinus]